MMFLAQKFPKSNSTHLKEVWYYARISKAYGDQARNINEKCGLRGNWGEMEIMCSIFRGQKYLSPSK